MFQNTNQLVLSLINSCTWFCMIRKIASRIEPAVAENVIMSKRMNEGQGSGNTSKISVEATSVGLKKGSNKTKAEFKNGKVRLFPPTNYWGYTFGEDQRSGKQFLVMLEGPEVPQDVLEELVNSQGHESEEDDFQEFPPRVRKKKPEQKKSPERVGRRKSLGYVRKGINTNKKQTNAGKGDLSNKAKLIKSKEKPKALVQERVHVVDSAAGDASFKSLYKNTNAKKGNKDEVPKWMDDVVANFIRSNQKPRRLERQTGMRSCTRWLRKYANRYGKRVSSLNSLDGSSKELATLNRPSLSPVYSEQWDGDNGSKVRYYPDFSAFFGEVPVIMPKRIPRKHFVVDDVRNQSFEFLHEDCDELEKAEYRFPPTFAKFETPKVKKALERLSQLELKRISKEYHVPPKTPLFLCSKGGSPPEGRRKLEKRKLGPSVGPFYRCPINHISGVVLRRPLIRKKNKRAQPFDPGCRPHFLPFRRDFKLIKEGKDCCSCDKWRGYLGVGNIFDAEQYHRNYLNCVTYNREAQLKCKTERCERCRFLGRPVSKAKRPELKKKAGGVNAQRLAKLSLPKVICPREPSLVGSPPELSHSARSGNTNNVKKVGILGSQKPGWRR